MKEFIEGMPGELVTRVIRQELDAIRKVSRRDDRLDKRVLTDSRV